MPATLLQASILCLDPVHADLQCVRLASVFHNVVLHDFRVHEQQRPVEGTSFINERLPASCTGAWNCL